MTLTVHIPGDLAGELGAGFEDFGLAALEALAAEAYGKGVLSLEQVRTLLELGSRWEAQAVLARHGAWPGPPAEKILTDAHQSSKYNLAARMIVISDKTRVVLSG